ncbi:hypothetical protein B0T26DRAFT_749308 [Lasiosphaeria miniovina]|uniref:3'-5' exonuclease domain-containing protein n=1 Tax=Lasiosphaeria miniovina TaxID=1954250 RepID=A0AA40ATP3_9PEZI|nr:uncharacterized protein B0T26DRAFT_749308 [Lasiosphaeria miniovina]KAK0721831.1 hypothetical protein B0T26DRAFT_749308 [Lasiosphaeria miniovina]
MATTSTTSTTSTPTTAVISSTAELEEFLSSMPSSSTLYLDLEGNRLSRHGTISLITILLHPQKTVKLIDVLSLGESAFTVTSGDGRSLKSIFEDPSIPKCLWDNASRAGDKKYLHGLDKAIRFDLRLGFIELNSWIRSKNEIKSLMPANIFAAQPLEARTIQYCTNVIHLPDLHAFYLRRISRDWLAKAREESSRRATEAHSPEYEPESPTKRLEPWGSGNVLSLDDWLEELEDQHMEDLSRDMLGDDGHWDFEDDSPTSCRDIISERDYYLYYSD